MVNISKPKLTLLQQDLLRMLFMRAGMTFNAHELAVTLEVSQPAIAKALPGMEKVGLIHVEKSKTSKRFSITLKREKPLVVGLKRADNLRLIYESGLEEILREKFPGCAVILFGSFSRGEDIHSSDIDIALVGSKDKSVDIESAEKILMKKISINFFRSFRHIDDELRNNILGGILLSGWVEL